MTDYLTKAEFNVYKANTDKSIKSIISQIAGLQNQFNDIDSASPAEFNKFKTLMEARIKVIINQLKQLRET